MLEREGQLAIGAASVFYQGILDEIEKNDYDVFTRRASLSTLGKVSRIPSLWLKVRALQSFRQLHLQPNQVWSALISPPPLVILRALPALHSMKMARQAPFMPESSLRTPGMSILFHNTM